MPADRSGGGGFDQGLKAARIARRYDSRLGREFGRTPMVESNPDAGRSLGRDHHNRAFSLWLAGGGVKPGVTYGETDEFGFNVAGDPAHVHDLHATILHLLGFDHTKLTYRFQEEISG